MALIPDCGVCGDEVESATQCIYVKKIREDEIRGVSLNKFMNCCLLLGIYVVMLKGCQFIFSQTKIIQ